MHVVGPSGGFEFESRESSKPWESQRYANIVDVGTLTVAATSAQTVRALRSVPINNRDREFDCQKWVEDALKIFKNAGHLSTESYDKGVDGMVDAIAEVEDAEE